MRLGPQGDVRRLGRWMIAALCFATLSGCRETSEVGLPAPFAYLPADTSILLVANVPAFADTPAFAEIERDVLATEGIGEILQESEVSLRDTVLALYIAMSGVGDPRAESAPQGLSALLVTSLADGFLEDVMARAEHSFQLETVEGLPVWVQRGADEEVAVAALPGGLIGFGLVGPVSAMVSRAATGAPGLSSEASIVKSLADLDMTSSAWGAAELEGHRDIAGAGNPLSSSLALVDYLTWTANHDAAVGLTVHVDAICSSVDNAQRVRSYVETLIGLAAMGGGSDTDLGQVLSSSTLAVEGTRASLTAHVPSEVLRAWVEGVGESGPLLPGRPR